MSMGFDISCSFCCFEAARGGVASLLTGILSLYLRKQAFPFIISLQLMFWFHKPSSMQGESLYKRN